MQSAIVRVTGMHCAGCESDVQRRFASLPGIVRVEADAGKELAGIESTNGLNASLLGHALEGTDFHVPRERQHLIVEGMTCNGCMRTVRKKLEDLPLVERVDVDLGAGHTVVLHSGVPVEEMLRPFDGTKFHVRPDHSESVDQGETESILSQKEMDGTSHQEGAPIAVVVPPHPIAAAEGIVHLAVSGAHSLPRSMPSTRVGSSFRCKRGIRARRPRRSRDLSGSIVSSLRFVRRRKPPP